MTPTEKRAAKEYLAAMETVVSYAMNDSTTTMREFKTLLRLRERAFVALEDAR